MQPCNDSTVSWPSARRCRGKEPLQPDKACVLRLSRGRFVAAVVLLLVPPVATTVPALAALALVTAVWLALHAYALVWWREARAESRSVLASP